VAAAAEGAPPAHLLVVPVAPLVGAGALLGIQVTDGAHVDRHALVVAWKTLADQTGEGDELTAIKVGSVFVSHGGDFSVVLNLDVDDLLEEDGRDGALLVAQLYAITTTSRPLLVGSRLFCTCDKATWLLSSPSMWMPVWRLPRRGPPWGTAGWPH